MAELADALDSGSSESNFMEVQVLLSAPRGLIQSNLFSFAPKKGENLLATPDKEVFM